MENKITEKQFIKKLRKFNKSQNDWLLVYKRNGTITSIIVLSCGYDSVQQILTIYPDWFVVHGESFNRTIQNNVMKKLLKLQKQLAELEKGLKTQDKPLKLNGIDLKQIKTPFDNNDSITQGIPLTCKEPGPRAVL
ncbi:hypothetical protein [Limosilactobacillus reuteri]|uniref:hypothetical protein n=1 Tax=Limosilactobacillus reuteri TaxID=1598 RepID=UPI00214C20E2|nr:hypothetical protein [Limosilactobacillus reuteri]